MTPVSPMSKQLYRTGHRFHFLVCEICAAK